MWVNRRLFKSACLVVSLELLTVSSATAEAGRLQIEQATAVVAALHEALLSVAAEQNLNVQQRAEELAPVVRDSFDFTYISRFLLRRAWSELDTSQQQSFTELFERLSIASYANRFADVGTDTLVIDESRPQGETRVQVMARVVLEERTVPLSYLLQPGNEQITDQQGEQWLIVNVIADGVSDLALRRAEYNRVISDTGFDGLLQHIEQQIDELE